MTVVERRAQVVCVAVLGRFNEPLIVHCTADDVEAIEMESLFFMTLDAVEDAVVAKAAAGESFLNLVYAVDNINIYGLCAPSRTKILIAVRWEGLHPAIDIIKSALGRIYEEYVQLTCNPFYTPLADFDGNECAGFIGALHAISADIN